MGGVPRYSRSAMFRRSGRAAKKSSGQAWKDVAPSQKAVVASNPRFYPAHNVRRKIKSSKSNHRPTRLRPTITPGTVVILLAGRFRGKRVVVLGQLSSGLLLVTGPFKINGVPLRRVNQAYVIATSTKVDLGSFQLDAKFNDAYFSKEKTAKRSGTEGEFFKDGEKEKKAFPAEKAADQKSVDKAIIAAVAGVPNLSKYLSATFGLTKGQ